MLNEHGMQNAKPVVIPPVNRNDDDDESEEASAEEHRSLRRIVGKSQVFASLRNAGSRTEAASTKQSVLSSDCVHRQRLGWRSTHARKSMSSWVIMLDGFLISAGARTLSVIAQSSCEAEHIAATAATSEAKYIQALFLACGQHVNIHLRSDSSGAIGVEKEKRSATVASSGRSISVVASGVRQQEHSNQRGAWD